MMPGLVRAVIQVSQQFRCAPHHGDVGFVVYALKKFTDVLECVNMFDEAIAARQKRLFERLRSAYVARPRCCRKQQNPRLRLHLRKFPRNAARIMKPCAARRRVSPECLARLSANLRNASGSPESRGSTAARPAGRACGAKSCRAASPGAGAAPLPAIPPTQF